MELEIEEGLHLMEAKQVQVEETSRAAVRAERRFGSFRRKAAAQEDVADDRNEDDKRQRAALAIQTKARQRTARRRTASLRHAQAMEAHIDPKAPVFMGGLAVRGRSEGMRRFFVLTRESIRYWESEVSYKADEKCRGYVRHKDIVSVTAFGLGFKLRTVHSNKGLELRCETWGGFVKWRAAWKLCSSYRGGALEKKFHSLQEVNPELDREIKDAASTAIASRMRCNKQKSQFLAKKPQLQAMEICKANARKVRLEQYKQQSKAPGVFPWKRIKATKWDKLKGVSSFKLPETSYGAAAPEDSPFDVPVCQELCGLADLKFAFQMLDKPGRGTLKLSDARNFFRCLGWVISDTELDKVLAEVDITRPPRNPEEAAAMTSAPRGPWRFEQLVKASEILQSTRTNSSLHRLLRVLEATAEGFFGHEGNGAPSLSLYDLEDACGPAIAQLGLGPDELALLSQAIWMGRGPEAPEETCEVVTLRMTDRILHPESILDTFQAPSKSKRRPAAASAPAAT
eukprot:TRINITY_DN11507_c0_g1_i6.p1 TRINITY_DN11507_c0_g1~~TRINITY_DN11507_c0_g1_i6.p1  ORF type:complete len:513 (+),score=122.17 TRINITY_DN11507_c0_g1_i6:817-2355(+)